MAQVDNAYSTVVTAAGTANIQVRSSARQTWSISQVSTEVTTAPGGAAGAPPGSTSTMRKNDSLVTALVAAGDVAGGDPPTILTGNDVVDLDWAGCTPGAVVKAYIVFDDGVTV